MGMGMGTGLYPLPGRDGDETKVSYPLGLGMGMWMNFFYGDGYEDVDEFFLREWVWDSETRTCPAPLPSLLVAYWSLKSLCFTQVSTFS